MGTSELGGSLPGSWQEQSNDLESGASGLTSQWYALQVRPRWERRVALALTGKGYEHYLPLYPCRRRNMAGTRVTELSLFPGYLFCRLSLWHGPRVVTCPGVVRIVSLGRIPVPVPEREIAAIKRTVASGLLVEPHSYLRAGQAVQLLHGPLAGLKGILVRIKSRQRLVISVALLQRSVAVELDSPCGFIELGGTDRVYPVFESPTVHDLGLV